MKLIEKNTWKIYDVITENAILFFKYMFLTFSLILFSKLSVILCHIAENNIIASINVKSNLFI